MVSNVSNSSASLPASPADSPLAKKPAPAEGRVETPEQVAWPSPPLGPEVPSKVGAALPDMVLSVLMPYTDLTRLFTTSGAEQAARVTSVQNQLQQGVFVVDPDKIAHGLGVVLQSQRPSGG